MIINIIYPSSHHRTGGVVVLYEWANALARRGHEVHFIHGPRTEYRINDLGELPPFRFEDEVRHHIVDALDDPGPPDGDIVMFAPGAPRRLGLEVGVVQGHRMFTEEIERDLFRVPAPKVCVASWLVDVGLGYGVPGEQLWYVPLGIDHEVFALRTPLDARPVDVAMLFHPHREKGYRVGLAALEELLARRPGLQAVVFGMNRPGKRPPGAVRYVQGATHRELADQVYNATRVFMQPSNHEGFGYTAVEAMACGCALVSTDNGGSRDYALPGETALVVPPGDAAGLAACVERLLDDDELRIRLATAGERHVRKFDWDVSAEMLETFFERYLADPDRYRRPPGDEVVEEVG
ncbi:MAG: glycosyltransferase family 1 [Acidimicrobiia bacterium]|nr:MAG: glycosyltransferase family 1 [Acidimicrobiia bacterium]